MHKLFITYVVLFLSNQNILTAQNSSYLVKLKSISFENKAIEVPQVYSIQKTDTVNLKKVNEKIFDRLELLPKAPKHEKDYEKFVSSLVFFRDYSGYLNIQSTYVIEGDFVEINIEGDYVEFEGKPLFEIHQIYKKETFYVDIKNNEVFNFFGYGNGVKLKYFFEPKRYIELLSNTWIPRIQKIKKKYPDGIEYEYTCEDCSSPNAHLSSFSFEHEIGQENLSFFLKSQAYYRDLCYQSFCSPEMTLKYPIDKVEPLLKENFDLSKYNKLERLSKIVFYKKNLENNSKKSILISGKIDSKYPFLMALDISDKNDIHGYYLYTSNRKLIELRGSSVRDKKLEIRGYLNNKLTGEFELEYEDNFTSEYDIEKFLWSSPDRKKSYEVEVDDFDIY